MDMELELRARHCKDLYDKGINAPEWSREACDAVKELEEEEMWAECAEKEIRDADVGPHHLAARALRNAMLENISKHSRQLQEQLSRVGGRIPDPTMRLSGKIVDTSV